MEAKDAKTLIVSGTEGSGKSTIAAAFAQQLPRLLQDDDAILCPIFLDYTGDFANDIVRQYLSTAVSTTLKRRPELLNKDFLDLHFDSAKSFADTEDCRHIFEDLALQFSSIFLLVDNIEAYGPFKIANALWSTAGERDRSWLKRDRKATSNGDIDEIQYTLRLLCFSKSSSSDYSWAWKNWNDDSPNKPIQLVIPEEAVKKDMAIYVQQTAPDIADMFQGEEAALTATEIEQALLTGPANNFTLIRAFIDFIRHQPTVADVREAMKQIPPDIEQLYLKVLGDLSSYRDGRTILAFEVFKLLVGSFRPLELSELAEILAVEPGVHAINPSRRYPQDRFEYLVRALCGPFIMVENDTVHLVSSSTKSFFTDLSVEGGGKTTECTKLTFDTPRSKRFSLAAKDIIAKKCFAYLSLSRFSGAQNSLPAVGDREGWLKQFPFFNYASNCWLNHVFDLADHLKGPAERNHRKEFGFDAQLLQLLSTFLTSSNCWTYLEGSLLFSSAREVRETLLFCQYPIGETNTFMKDTGYNKTTSIKSVYANILVFWAFGVDSILAGLEECPLETALQVIREMRDDQIAHGITSSLPHIGKTRYEEGYKLPEAPWNIWRG